MIEKGYQVIEPSIVGKWLGTVKHEGILFCLLNWLVHLLLSNDYSKLSNVEIEVLCVEYDSKYPAIGVHYKNPEDQDLEEYITSRIEFYLTEKSVIDFLKYAFSKNESWIDSYQEFIS